MTCSDWESQLDAFADGELAAELAPTLRAHLDECSNCRDALNTLRSLRVALVRRWADESAPAGLAERVRRTVATQDAVRSRSFEQTAAADDNHSAPGLDEAAGWSADGESVRLEPDEGPFQRVGLRAGRSPARRRWGLSLATVGTVLLVFGLYHAFLPSAATSRDVTIVASDRFSEIRQLHAAAVLTRGSNPATPLAPNTVPNLAAKLSSMADLKVIVPDLSNDGYELLGADLVEIEAVPAAQVLYRSAKGGMLSVFTLRRMEKLGTPEPRRGVRSFFASTLQTASVVGWHDGAQTYAICADVDQDALFRLIDDFPTAERGLFDAMRSVLATIVPP